MYLFVLIGRFELFSFISVVCHYGSLGSNTNEVKHEGKRIYLEDGVALKHLKKNDIASKLEVCKVVGREEARVSS